MQYLKILKEPKLEILYGDDITRTENFVLKSNRFGSGNKRIFKDSLFWTIQSGNFYYVLYKIPAKTTTEHLMMIENTMTKEFNAAFSPFTIYSLFGIVTEDETPINYHKISIVEGDDLVNFIVQAGYQFE